MRDRKTRSVGSSKEIQENHNPSEKVTEAKHAPDSLESQTSALPSESNTNTKNVSSGSSDQTRQTPIETSGPRNKNLWLIFKASLIRIGEELVIWLKTLASAAVYATLIVTFGFQVARVEGQSMAPPLIDQDRLIVNKLVYRFSAPRRGDIAMLYYPVHPAKSFVKRIIGEEGDRVRIVDGRVHVNDIPLLDDYIPEEFRSHDIWGPQVIPEGYYFVMGDHRNTSSDSRHWGMVPKKYIIGKVQIRWWPFTKARVFN